MKLHRFYISPDKLPEDHKKTPMQNGTLLAVSFPEFVHQIKKVLKLYPGEKLIFFTGDGNEYVSSIVSYEGKEGVTLKIGEIQPNDVSFRFETHLFFSIVKKDNVEWILEKGTEVGVSHFIPVVSARSEKKDINMERAEKIVIEAIEQCGRNIPPAIHPVIKLEEVFEHYDMPFIVFEKGAPLLDTQEFKKGTIGILIGPEGGWTKEELEMFAAKNAVFRSLGPTVLRAETAAIVGSAKMNS